MHQEIYYNISLVNNNAHAILINRVLLQEKLTV